MITHFGTKGKSALPEVFLALFLFGKMQLFTVSQEHEPNKSHNRPFTNEFSWDRTVPHIASQKAAPAPIRGASSAPEGTRSWAISALNPPTPQQDEQSGQPPTPAENQRVRRARVQVQSILCVPAVTFSCRLWHINIGGESHLLCISLGGTGRKRYFTEESHKKPLLRK